MRILLLLIFFAQSLAAVTMFHGGAKHVPEQMLLVENVAELKEGAIVEKHELVEILTNLAPDAIAKLASITTISNVVDSLPMATLFNRLINEDLDSLRADPYEAGEFYAAVFVNALNIAKGPEHFPRPEDFMKLAIKTYIEVYIALFQPVNNNAKIAEAKNKLKTYVVKALLRGKPTQVRGLTRSKDGQLLMSPRVALSLIEWTLNSMPNFGNNFLIFLQRIPYAAIENELEAFDYSPEGVDDLANFLTPIGMDFLAAFEIDPFFFREEFFLAKLITLKIQIGFALYDLLEGRPSVDMDEDGLDGEAAVKRLIVNALTQRKTLESGSPTKIHQSSKIL